MKSSANTIGPLNKVRLAMTLTSGQALDLLSQPFDYSFIYGLGRDGITPFEKALFGKSLQASIDLLVGINQLQSIFGHLACDLMQIIPLDPPFELKATVIAVEATKDREIIAAMAKSSECGAGCDCGCGC